MTTKKATKKTTKKTTKKAAKKAAKKSTKKAARGQMTPDEAREKLGNMTAEERTRYEHDVLREEEQAHAATVIPTVTLDSDFEIPEGEDAPVGQHELTIKRRQLMSQAKPAFIDFNKMYRADNFREADDLDIPGMKLAYRLAGVFQPEHPIIVSKKDDGRYLVLCGNRRTEALEDIEVTEPDLFERLLRPWNGKVPALVLEGLDRQEENIVRSDHSKYQDRKPLGDLSLFKCVLSHVNQDNPPSQAALAELLGLMKKDAHGNDVPNRSLIQQRINLARLPKKIQDEFIKLWTKPKLDDNGNIIMEKVKGSDGKEHLVPTAGKDSTKVRVGDIAKFYKEYDPTQPDGGESFKKLCEEKLGPPIDEDKTTRPMNGKSMVDTAMKVKSHVLIYSLKKAAGLKEYQAKQWSDIDAFLNEQKEAEMKLAAIQETLNKKEFVELMKKCEGNLEKIRERESEKSETSF